jgi:hypothetical protein
MQAVMISSILCVPRTFTWRGFCVASRLRCAAAWVLDTLLGKLSVHVELHLMRPR